MKTSVEVQVLQWFERALAQKPASRKSWLADQDMDQDVRERVLRLLDADQAFSGFLEETAVADEPLPPEFPKVGERLGAWELLKPLESGGMGVVYLGRRADDVYDQQVAIKLVRPVHLLAAAGFRRQLISRFEDERSILARMSHPNVARILDGGSTGAGIPYLVMEFVDGVSLTDYCKSNKLDVPARLALFAKVCDGVQEAHRHLIVHRDLKPDNVLVGENGEPRLLDFGIAKILEQEPLPTDGKRHTSLSAMTPAYASPEQVRQQALTTSSDVYSLGVMLYQLLAGVRPYELGGLRPAEAEAVVCDTLPDPMRRMLEKAALTDAERKARRAQITPDVERIVAKAMHKESARRYGSAQELADDIRRYLDGQPVLAHPDSAGYRMRKFVQRHRWGVAAGGMALAAILVASGVAVHQAREAQRLAGDTNDINEFLLEVLAYSDPTVAGSEITLAQAAEVAAEKVEDRFRGRPHLSATLHHVLGTSMLTHNNLELAERELRLALAQATQTNGPDSIFTLRVRESLAGLLMQKGEVEAAVEAWKGVIKRIEQQGLQSDPLYRTSLTNLGNAFWQMGEYAKAESYFNVAMELPAAGDGQAANDRAVLLASVAGIAHEQGELEKADALYREARAVMEARYPDGSPELATLINNHALLLQQQGQLEAGYAMGMESLQMKRKAFAGPHPSLIPVLSSQALLALRLGKREEGLGLAEEAVAMADALREAPHADRVLARFALTAALMSSGRFADAGRVLAIAEAEASDLENPPPELQGLAFLRDKLCKDAGGRDVPGC